MSGGEDDLVTRAARPDDAAVAEIAARSWPDREYVARALDGDQFVSDPIDA